ncbi:hypothetical protein SISNIDRAFT_467350 [Sistotremastrum niveocremeum HHB9708]|uniref:DUF6535 domain-containing protein n=1 Tax=Sistotremastrum niveocremeum HHB9708 TaxID=1314777 RepID=A0A164SRW8_9AGAM|nr:hypothetical protein SISNIDRAFT_467350 [Sistotremastrum niveocremeum HHB9708]
MPGSPVSVHINDIELNSPHDTSTPSHDLFNSPIFHRLLTLVAEQTAILREQKETLLDHGKKLETLAHDAVSNDQPYDADPEPMKNEQTWSAVYEIATAKMKEEADEWKGLMDVSLVFIAIFLTVLTAFLVPAAQILLPDSPPSESFVDGSTLPPLPPSSDENVCALYYLALITAMCNAVLCVIGRQWVAKLLSRPSGRTHRERTIRFEERKRLANGWIKPLVTVLYWSLLLSIGLFVAGLLYRLQNLSKSFDENAASLQATWSLGVAMVAIIIAGITATTVHAIRFESSPFDGLSSRIGVKIVDLAARRWKSIGSWRIRVDCESPSTLLRAYMSLIADAHDRKLLDRAVASFSYAASVNSGEHMMDLVREAYERFMATDSSLRVRETVKAQISRFSRDCHKVLWEAGAVTSEPNTELIDFLLKRCHFPNDFPAYATFMSYTEKNRDLRKLGTLSVDECIAKVLCTYDQNGRLGDRNQIFNQAVFYSQSLLRERRENDVARILLHVDPLSLSLPEASPLFHRSEPRI